MVNAVGQTIKTSTLIHHHHQNNKQHTTNNAHTHHRTIIKSLAFVWFVSVHVFRYLVSQYQQCYHQHEQSNASSPPQIQRQFSCGHVCVTNNTTNTNNTHQCMPPHLICIVVCCWCWTNTKTTNNTQQNTNKNNHQAYTTLTSLSPTCVL